MKCVDRLRGEISAKQWHSWVCQTFRGFCFLQMVIYLITDKDYSRVGRHKCLSIWFIGVGRWSICLDLPKSLLYIAYDFLNFEVAELCLQYGLDMTKQNWLLDTACLPIRLRGNDNLYKKLLHLYQNPLDLIVLARNEVRRSLGRRDISKTVAQLGLPKRLEDFVSCKW